jgi:hypothetical protein
MTTDRGNGVDRERRREISRQGGLAKARKDRQPEGDEAAPFEGVSFTTAPFPVEGWIDFKDYQICKLNDRKIELADIEVEIAQTKRDVERGKLFTRDQISQRDESLALIFREQIRSVTDLIAAHVPPERVNAAQRAAADWTDAVLTAVADAIDGMGGK